MTLNEAETRHQLIDQQLDQAGWHKDRRNLAVELRLTTAPTQTAEPPPTYRAGDEFVDYALYGRTNHPLAIVEAKRTSRDPLAGQRQAADYADRLQQKFGEDPFIFLANGQETWFWDRQRYPLRPVSGFFTRDDLERLAFQREHRLQLNRFNPRPEIVDRLYQIEAIKRVSEKMSDGRRHFLLVMATGSGKTRTVIALIDLLMRARWVQRVLFLADRRELVRQALGDFKEHMPNETRARVEQGEIDHTARIHVATYPSMMQVYTELSPGYYDLIVADESHRSIYNRYKALLDYFDAMQLGLTATPTDYIDHNTFDLFDCPDGLPTFHYSFADAVSDDYLVNYKVHYARTAFQIEGIKAGQLPPEMARQLAEQGIELGEINFEGSDLERRVTNTGTTDAIVGEFMDNCRRDASETLPAKSIIFAMSHRHAVEIFKSFNRLYPSLQQRGLAQIIDSHMERTDKLLDDFKRQDMPRVAISVDMLDTGIDVPAIQNLVFAKPVFSQVKFWQMIGRGTRLWRDPHSGKEKESFLIFDFWNNFTYFNMNPEGEIASPTEPLPTRLFRLRLEKLVLQQGLGQIEEAAQTAVQCQAMLAQLPLDNINVQPHLAELQTLTRPEAWLRLDEAQISHLSQTIGPLLRFLPDVNLPVMVFTARTERLACAHLCADEAQIERLREQITDDLSRLPPNLPAVRAVREQLAWVNSDGFWDHLDNGRIHTLQDTFAPLMRYRQRETQQMITLHLPDQIATRWIIYGPGGEGAFADSYREQVEAYVRDLAAHHPTLRKLQQGQALTESDVQAVSHALNQADLFITEETLRQTYARPQGQLTDFVRHILGLSHLPNREEEMTAVFDQFIADHPHFTARQITFLRVLRSQVLRQTRLSAADLERAPFNRVGRPQQLFSAAELAELLAFANQFAG